MKSDPALNGSLPEAYSIEAPRSSDVLCDALRHAFGTADNLDDFAGLLSKLDKVEPQDSPRA